MENYDDNFLAITNSNDLNQSLQVLDQRLTEVNSISNTVKDIATIFHSMKQIDADMRKMELQLDAFLAKSKHDLEKYKISATIVEKKIDKISDNIDIFMDKIFSIETKTASPDEIKYRGELLQMISKQSEILSNMSIQLLIN